MSPQSVITNQTLAHNHTTISPSKSLDLFSRVNCQKNLTILLTLILLFLTTHDSNLTTRIHASSQLYSLVNQQRISHNLQPLTPDPLLEVAALAKAQHMIEFNYYGHFDQETNSQPWDFIDQTGYQYIHAGENLARGFSDDQSVIQGWLDSEPHRNNMLAPHYTHTGIAIITDTNQPEPTTLVVQLLATPITEAQLSDPQEVNLNFLPTLIANPHRLSIWPLVLGFIAGVITVILTLKQRKTPNPPSKKLWRS